MLRFEKQFEIFTFEKMSNSRFFKKIENGKWMIAQEGEEGAEEKDIDEIDFGNLVKPQLTKVRAFLTELG